MELKNKICRQNGVGKIDNIGWMDLKRNIKNVGLSEFEKY